MNVRSSLFPVSGRSLVAIALLSASLLIPAGAAAQVADADRATARTLASEGQDALERKDYPTAADRFARADALVHAPTLMLGLARAQVGLGKLLEAQETYNRIVREGVAPGSPPAFFRGLEEARREVEKLAPRVPSVTLVIEGAPAAAVTIDDAPVPAAAIGVKRLVDPGKHLIRATAEGMQPAEATVTLAEGKNERVTLALVPAPAAPAPAVTPPPVAAPTPPAADRGAPASRLRIAGFALAGVGAAGLVLGAVTGGLAVQKHGHLAELCKGGTCGPSAYPQLDSYHLMGALSTAGIVTGVAAAGAGVVLIVVAPRSQPKAQASVTPVVGPAYLGVEGRF